MAAKKLKVDLDESLKKLDITIKGLVNTSFLGNYKSSFRGSGLEFDSYRRYDINDDSKFIDWKASIRANLLLVKQFIEERNLEVMFLVDSSSTMISGSTPKLKSEYVAEIVGSLAYTVLHTGDTVGMLMFANNVVKEIPPSSGMEQFYKISETLINPNNYGGSFDLSNALNYCMENLKPMTLLIILSDFIIPSNNWELLLKISSEKFDLIGFMVRDPIDRTIPSIPGQVLVEDPQTGSRMIIEPKLIAQQYAEETENEIKMLRNIFRESKADFADFYTDRGFVEKLLKLFFERRLKWRK